MFTIQQVSNYGTSTPAYSRTLVQGLEILQWFKSTPKQKEDAKACLFDLKDKLISCVQIRDLLNEEINKSSEFDGNSVANGPGALAIPGIPELKTKVESFLLFAKLSVAATGRLLLPYYGIDVGHKFNSLAKWSSKQFGAEDRFTTMLSSWEPFVQRLVQMRNCVDHPTTTPGAPLIVLNFRSEVIDGVSHLFEPHWGITDGVDLRPILADFDLIIDHVIVLSENVLANMFYKLRWTDMVVLEEIPKEQQDPNKPQRIRVAMASHD